MKVKFFAYMMHVNGISGRNNKVKRVLTNKILVNIKMIYMNKIKLRMIITKRIWIKKIQKATRNQFMEIIWYYHWMDTLSIICVDIIFKRKVIRFISNNIPIFDKHTHEVIEIYKYPTKSDKWKISTSVPLKNIVSGKSTSFVTNTHEKMILSLSLKKKIFQFHILFVYIPVHQQHNTLQYQVLI